MTKPSAFVQPPRTPDPPRAWHWADDGPETLGALLGAAQAAWAPVLLSWVRPDGSIATGVGRIGTRNGRAFAFTMPWLETSVGYGAVLAARWDGAAGEE